MLSTNSVVLVAVVLIASQLRGSEPTVVFEFGNQNGSVSIELPTASVRTFVLQHKLPIGELKTVLGSSNGQLKYRLSGTTPDDNSRKKASDRKSSIVQRFERQSAMVVDEIEENCSPSSEQLAKIGLAARGECVQLQKLLTRLDQLTIEPDYVSTDGFQRLCEEVYNVNTLIAQGPLRDESILYSICKSTLNEDQKSALRVFYVQPLLKILSDRGVTSDQMHVQRLEQFIGEENVEPLQLRNNYGQQYEAVIGLGEQKLASIFQPARLIALNSLGKSEYRISLSISQRIKSAPA